MVRSSESVTSQSEELTQSANEVLEGSRHIAVTMEELANGSELQVRNATDLSSIMSNFTAKVEQVNTTSGHVQESLNNALKLTNEGSELMASSTKQMSIIERIVHEAVEKVVGLDTHSKEISGLVTVIQGGGRSNELTSIKCCN